MTHALALPLLMDLGPAELLIIFGIIVLLFGASKLPDLARGSGRALRIFKAETKGLMDDDEKKPGTTATASTGASTTPEQRQLELQRQAEAEELRAAEQRVADLRARSERRDEPGTGAPGTR